MEKNFISLIGANIATFFIYVMGGIDAAFKFVITCMVIDYITGIGKAIKMKKLNSKIGIQGIIKKIGILCLVALATSLDGVCGDTGLIRNMTLYFIGANEGISILENLGKMNIPIPNIIMEKLEQLKEGNIK